MKNIEDIIRNNKEFFDGADPSDGHFERFQQEAGDKMSEKKP